LRAGRNHPLPAFDELRRETGIAPAAQCFHVAVIRPEPMRKRLSQFCALAFLLISMSGCNTVTEMVEAHIPVRETGRPRIVISLRAQEAYLYRGKVLVASSRISSGR
jgi:predicted glycosyltransferase